MRPLCGAIITAGALIGLGLTALGIGTRYQSFADIDKEGNVRWLTFKTLDTPLSLILILMVIALLVGLVTLFLGLAFHHHKRHHELQRNGTIIPTGSRVVV